MDAGGRRLLPVTGDTDLALHQPACGNCSTGKYGAKVHARPTGPRSSSQAQNQCPGHTHKARVQPRHKGPRSTLGPAGPRRSHGDASLPVSSASPEQKQQGL